MAWCCRNGDRSVGGGARRNGLNSIWNYDKK